MVYVCDMWVWYVCDCVCIYDVTKVASVMQISRYVAAFPPGPDGSVGASGTLSAQDLELAVSSQLLDLSLPIQFRTCWVNDFFQKFQKWSLNVVNPPGISGSGESTSDLSVGAVVNI